MALSNETIKQRLTEKFGNQLMNWEEPYSMLTFTAPKDLNLKVLQSVLEYSFYGLGVVGLLS